MFKLQSSDKDLRLLILFNAMMFGMMLLLIKFLGELHGLISTVVLLIGQTAFLNRRVNTLEREVRISRETSDRPPAKFAEKIG